MTAIRVNPLATANSSFGSVSTSTHADIEGLIVEAHVDKPQWLVPHLDRFDIYVETAAAWLSRIKTEGHLSHPSSHGPEVLEWAPARLEAVKDAMSALRGVTLNLELVRYLLLREAAHILLAAYYASSNIHHPHEVTREELAAVVQRVTAERLITVQD